jgi:hypothetical protein
VRSSRKRRLRRPLPVQAPSGRPRRRTFTQWINSDPVIGTLCAAIALGCGGGAIDTHAQAVALRDHGIHTTAVVTQTHGGRDSYVVLDFTTRDGQRVTARVGNYDWRSTPRIGDQPTILYDPADPEGNVADTRLGPDFVESWLLGIAAVVAALVSALTYTGRIDWWRIYRNRRGRLLR